MRTKAWLAMVAAGVLGVGLATTASAQETFWYNAYGGFVEGSEGEVFPDPVTYGAPNTFGQIQAGDPLFSEVAWGTEVTGNSGLSLNDDAGLDQVAGQPEISILSEEGSRHINTGVIESTSGNHFGWLTHINETIDEAFGPDGATIDLEYYVDIYDNEAKEGDPVETLGALPFQLEVWETLNDPADGECPDGTETPCADRFRYRITMDGSEFGEAVEGLDLGTFDWQGSTYATTATGFFNGDGELVGEFWSPEETTSTGYVNLEIHEQVPEPATVGLMGVGLVGLAFFGFRRRRKTDLVA